MPSRRIRSVRSGGSQPTMSPPLTAIIGAGASAADYEENLTYNSPETSLQQGSSRAESTEVRNP